MPRHLALLLAALLLAGAGPAPAASAPAAAPALSAAEAGTWLARMHEAANQRNYQGTLVYSAGGVVSSSRVAHFRDGDQDYERVEALDGPPRRLYRHNDVVVSLWPQGRVAVIERREPQALLAATVQPLEVQVLDRYELKTLGSERIAGREAQGLLLLPRDEYRYAQRLWVDRASGLVLRVDVLGPAQAVLESSAYSEVEIGLRAQPDSVLAPMKQLDGYRVVQRPAASARLEAEGWMLAAPVAGFRLAHCAKRPLPGDGAEPGAAGAAGPVLQAVFSDGLTHVSLFVETFDPLGHRKPMQTQTGATRTLMQRQAEHWWLTVVGDVPLATLRQFAAALERRH